MASKDGWPNGWMSGFCCMSQCEGTKPRSALTNTPMKTCEYIHTCTCKCHKLLDEMFKMADMERIAQPNPEYKPIKGDYWMPTAEDRAMMAAERIKSEKPVVIVESKMPEVLPPDAIREFEETPSGQRQRGQLEDEVKRVTDIWVAMASLGSIDPCTPAWVSEMIDAENPPSTGAITAVFDRWTEMGFATSERKPTRFTGYTPEGVQKGLHVMKVDYKFKKRNKAAAANRGVR